MTDTHRSAIHAAAALVGVPDGAPAPEVAGHLAGCSDCRRRLAALHHDAERIRALDFGPAPERLRVRVAAAAAVPGAATAGARGLALVVGLLLLLAAGVGIVAVGAQRLADSPERILTSHAGDRVRWTTDVVDLAAREFWIDVAGRRYVGSPVATVSSDPGSASYRTLEVSWREHGTPMRLYLYFAADETSWWVDEIATYDGSAKGEWTRYGGPFFRTPLGGVFGGDADIAADGPTPATIHLGGLRLATRAADLVNVPAGGGIVLGEHADPFEPGGPLHCSDILRLGPKDAEIALIRLGYRLSWRYVTTTGSNTGYWDPRKTAPDGILLNWHAVGTSGELILAVAAPDDPAAQRIAPPARPPQCPAATGVSRR